MGVYIAGVRCVLRYWGYFEGVRCVLRHGICMEKERCFVMHGVYIDDRIRGRGRGYEWCLHSNRGYGVCCAYW